MDNKKIANYALSFIQGKPEVFEYHNDDKSASIDIMFCTDENNSELVTLSTIGLCNADIGQEVDGKALRVELIILGDRNEDICAEILATAAFNVQQEQYCSFGLVLEDTITPYLADANVKHLVLMHPVFWDGYKYLELDDTIVAWLLAVPITEEEKIYIDKNGIEKFDELIVKSQVDLTDFYRSSCV